MTIYNNTLYNSTIYNQGSPLETEAGVVVDKWISPFHKRFFPEFFHSEYPSLRFLGFSGEARLCSKFMSSQLRCVGDCFLCSVIYSSHSISNSSEVMLPTISVKMTKSVDMLGTKVSDDVQLK